MESTDGQHHVRHLRVAPPHFVVSMAPGPGRRLAREQLVSVLFSLKTEPTPIIARKLIITLAMCWRIGSSVCLNSRVNSSNFFWRSAQSSPPGSRVATTFSMSSCQFAVQGVRCVRASGFPVCLPETTGLTSVSSTVSRPCTPELISSELLAFSTVSGISEPRRHRNDDLKPLKAWKKRGSHASAEKTDRSKVSSSPKRLGFISAIAQMT